MQYVLGVLACTPLMASTIAKAWDWAWNAKSRSILPTSLDRSLTVVQALLCAWFVLAPAVWALFAVAALYATMGIAVLWLRVHRGPADCGCWGRSRPGRLSFRLAATNLALAAAAAAVTMLEAVNPEFALRLFVLATVAIILFFLMVVVPAYRPLIKRYRELADRYRPWAAGFPHLRS
ncbi:hypothetical protein GCM10023075_56510 [Streptosporangium album]